MPTEEKTIEVQVVEVDGVTVRDMERPRPEAARAEWTDWRGWHGRVRRLDTRWWPLWAVLGALIGAVVLVVGLFLAVVIVAVRLVFAILRGIVGAIRG